MVSFSISDAPPFDCVLYVLFDCLYLAWFHDPIHGGRRLVF